MYIDILQHLEDVKNRLGPKSKTYEATLQAIMDNPEMRAHRDGGITRLCMAEANHYVDTLELVRGDDFYAYLYFDNKGVRIYSDPPLFFIGHKNLHGFGVHPAPGWTEEMKTGNINPDVIKKVQSFLGANAAVDYPEE